MSLLATEQHKRAENNTAAAYSAGTQILLLRTALNSADLTT
jgi:hypothetical protein